MTDSRRAVFVGVGALLTAGLLLPLVATSPAAQAKEPATSLDTNLTLASFAEPPMSAKPMYRWWMPLAYTDDDVLRTQLRDLAASGAGGVEVAPFVVAGEGNQSDAFLTQYGWGTPAWAHKMEVITTEALELGLRVDQNLGPHYPSTVPTLSSFNQPEAEQQLLYGWEVVAAGASRIGATPTPITPPPKVETTLASALSPGATELAVGSLGGFSVGDTISIGSGATTDRVTVTAVGSRVASPLVLSVSPLTQAQPAAAPVTNVAKSTRVRTVVAQCAATCTEPSGTPIALLPDSVRDVTSEVQEGELDFTAPNGGAPWIIIDFQQTASGLIGQRGGYTATQPNYVPDHLSAGGAQIQADFWDDSVLTETVRANLLAIGGGSIFEDSLEHGETQKWTWGLADRFAQARGYDISEALPALAGVGVQGTHAAAFDLGGVGLKAREDYRQTVSDLYIGEYLLSMQTWAKGHGLDFRAQPYGLPISTSQAAAVAGIPEGESLNFGSPNPLGAEQDHRVVASGAHLTGRNLVSVECCAVFQGGYRSAMAGANIGGQFSDPSPEGPLGGARSQGLLDSVFKSYAGGVNQLVWHGYAYPDAPKGVGVSGRDGGTWPGYQPWDIFGAVNVNDVFGPRQANWEDNTTVNEALARIQHVLRQGRAKLDLGVYYEDLGLAGSSAGVQQPEQHLIGTDSALSSAGFTYEYLAPSFLSDPELTPSSDGGLFEDRSGHKALILNDQRTISLRGAKDLKRLAAEGLNIFVVGQTPVETTGHSSDPAELAMVVQELLAQTSVVQVADLVALPSALSAAGITPAVTPTTPTPDIGLVRRAAEGTDYTFVYNRSASEFSQNLTIAGNGIPVRLDPWTGEMEPVAQYTVSKGRVTVPVNVGAHDVEIIALTQTLIPLGRQASEQPHAVASDAPVIFSPEGGLEIRVTKDGSYSTTLSDGTTVTTQVSNTAQPPGLADWSLNAQTWGPTPDATELTASRTTKTDQATVNLTPDSDGKLPSWLDIVGDVDLSRASGLGNYSTTFTLPKSWSSRDGLLLSLGDALDTARVTLNGTAIPVNQANRSGIDLRTGLQPGENTLEVRVATTMFNAVRATGDSNYQGGAWQRAGLMGPIALTAYQDVEVVVPEEPGEKPEPGTDTEGTEPPPGTGTDGVDPDPGTHPPREESVAGTAGESQRDPLAETGAQWIWLALSGAALISGGAFLFARKRRRTET